MDHKNLTRKLVDESMRELTAGIQKHDLHDWIVSHVNDKIDIHWAQSQFEHEAAKRDWERAQELEQRLTPDEESPFNAGSFGQLLLVIAMLCGLVALVGCMEWQVQKWITGTGSADAWGNSRMPLAMQMGVAALSTLTCIWAVQFYQQGRKAAGIAVYLLMGFFMLQMGLWDAGQPRYDAFWNGLFPPNPLNADAGRAWPYWVGLLIWQAISLLIVTTPALTLGMLKRVVMHAIAAIPYAYARENTARKAELVYAKRAEENFFSANSAHRDHIAQTVALKMGQKAALERKHKEPKELALGKAVAGLMLFVVLAGSAHAQAPDLTKAGMVGIWLDDSGGAPATDQAYANAIAPVIGAAVRNAPLGALVTVTSFGDSKAAPKLMWRSRIQARTTPDGMERAALVRTVEGIIKGFPAFIAKKGTEQESHIIGALYNAAQAMPETGKTELWVVSDLWEHTAAYDLSCIPNQKPICGLPKNPGFSLKGSTVHVLGAGAGGDSQRVMGMIELWKTFITAAHGRPDIKATGF